MGSGGFGRFSESQLGVAGARCTPIKWPSDHPRPLKLRPITTPRKPVRGDVKHSDPALAPPTLPASLAPETPLDPQTIRPTRRPRGSRPRITLLLILIKIPPDRISWFWCHVSLRLHTASAQSFLHVPLHTPQHRTSTLTFLINHPAPTQVAPEHFWLLALAPRARTRLHTAQFCPQKSKTSDHSIFSFL